MRELRPAQMAKDPKADAKPRRDGKAVNQRVEGGGMNAAIGQPGVAGKQVWRMELQRGNEAENRGDDQPDCGAGEHEQQGSAAGGVNLQRRNGRSGLVAGMNRLRCGRNRAHLLTLPRVIRTKRGAEPPLLFPPGKSNWNGLREDFAICFRPVSWPVRWAGGQSPCFYRASHNYSAPPRRRRAFPRETFCVPPRGRRPAGAERCNGPSPTPARPRSKTRREWRWNSR